MEEKRNQNKPSNIEQKPNKAHKQHLSAQPLSQNVQGKPNSSPVSGQRKAGSQRQNGGGSKQEKSGQNTGKQFDNKGKPNQNGGNKPNNRSNARKEQERSQSGNPQNGKSNQVYNHGNQSNNRKGQVNKQGNRPNNQNDNQTNARKQGDLLNNLIGATADNSFNEIREVFSENKTKSYNKTKENSKAPKLKVIFLGGVGEIGKNLTALQYGNDIIVIDCGVSFPTDDTPGIDLIIPDTQYLEENKDKIRGMLLTHGHEDHIGAVPFVAPKLVGSSPLPLYGSKLTLGLVTNKLIEHNCENRVKQIAVDDGSRAKLGVFDVEFVRVTHSVAGSFAIVVYTPVGTVFVSGDFKIDHTPRHSLPMNLPRIADIGKSGVLLMLCESTNIEREGFTLSESTVADKFAEYFEKEKSRRIIVATFSSNVDRLQELFELAKKYKRKIAISGRSMLNVIETASKAGYLSYEPSILVPINQIEKMQPHSLLVMCTGSQGEPMSALYRMAKGENSQIKVTKNDTIIISATPIPGNEKGVYSCINQLYMLGARVVYSAIEDIHVSGHAQKEELKLIHSLVRPKFFIPVHGEYRHLMQHAELAQKMGISAKNIAIPSLGDVAELSADAMSIKQKVTSGRVLIDGSGVGDVGDQLLKDRLALSQDGFVVIVCGVEGGHISVRPQVFARGSFYTGEGSNEQTVEELKQIAVSVLTSANLNNINLNALKKELQKQVRKYVIKKFDRFPMVIAVIMSSELDE